MPARRYREDGWERRLWPAPTERAVLALLATHGTEGVEERWGGRRPERLVIEARRREAQAGRQPAR